MTKKPCVLVVDDEPAMRESLKDWLHEDGYMVDLADCGEKAVEMLMEKNWEVILLDLKMPGMDGIETLKKIKEIRPEAEIIMMTAYATINTAINAMKQGAFDYLVKPFDPNEIEILIKKIVTHNELVIENILLKRQMAESRRHDEIIGTSLVMQNIYDLITRVAQTDSTILVTGESGTGKELVAKAIHGNSKRCYMPLVIVNCGALPDSLLESELFGYEKGAFTGANHTKKGRFEMADQGSLFLDEIGDITMKSQIDLLRVLQEKKIQRLGGEESIKIDARIIAATNRNLQEEIKKKNFREDLYYRLNVISIHLPPLRERKEDIPSLTNYFIRKYSLEMNKGPIIITPSALNMLTDYHWPGNIRELENVIERGIVIGQENKITEDDLPFSCRTKQTADMPKSLKGMEKRHIQTILTNTDWNISRTARELDIDRQTLYNKIKKYKIEKTDISE